jgi:hypothetical protein
MLSQLRLEKSGSDAPAETMLGSDQLAPDVFQTSPTHSWSAPESFYPVVAHARMSAIRKLPVGLLCRSAAMLRRRANQVHIFRRPALIQEGRFAIVTNVGRGMRWTYRCCSAHFASGRTTSMRT